MSVFKKPFFLAAALVLLTLSSCDLFFDEDDDDSNDSFTYKTALANVDYQNGNVSIFFDFSTGDITKVPHDKWDIAISTTDAAIIANSGDYGFGVLVFKSGSSTITDDLSANEADVIEYTFKDGTELYGTQTNANPFVGELATGTGLGNVFLVKDEAGIYYKVIFNSFGPMGAYTLTVVTGLSGGASNTITGSVDPSYGYIYFDLGTVAAVTMSPEKSKWDILFTRTNDRLTAGYVAGRSDVLLNTENAVEAGATEGSAINAVNVVSEVTLSDIVDIIGHSWYEFADGTFTVNTNTYVVKTTEGNYGKFQPGTFYGPSSEQFYMSFRYFYQGDGSTEFTN